MTNIYDKWTDRVEGGGEGEIMCDRRHFDILIAIDTN